jgi:hypothetical protein
MKFSNIEIISFEASRIRSGPDRRAAAAAKLFV